MSDYLGRLVGRSLQAPSPSRPQAISISEASTANRDAIFRDGSAPELPEYDSLPLREPVTFATKSRGFLGEEQETPQRAKSFELPTASGKENSHLEVTPIVTAYAAVPNAPFLSDRRETERTAPQPIEPPDQMVNDELSDRRTTSPMTGKETDDRARRSRTQGTESPIVAARGIEADERNPLTFSRIARVPEPKTSSQLPNLPWSNEAELTRDGHQPLPMVHDGAINRVKPKRAGNPRNRSEPTCETESTASTLFPDTTAVPKLPSKSLLDVQIVPASIILPPSAFPSPLRHEQKSETPSINVTIGRVEVRATPAPAPPSNNRRVGPAVMSLDEYLRRRAQGGRR